MDMERGSRKNGAIPIRSRSLEPRRSPAMSSLEATFALQIKSMNLPEPVREFKFHPSRKWKFDFAWTDINLAVEIEGGVWSGGRHSTGVGFTLDCEKYAEALCLGWRVLRVTGGQVKSMQALMWTKRLINDLRKQEA
jgi:hypothetical protein